MSPPGLTAPEARAGAGLTAWRVLLALAMAAILVLSLMSTTSDLPTTGWDKSNHLLGFGTLGLLGVRGWPRRAVAVLVALLAYGGLIEVLQSFTPDRSADWEDLVADGVGLGVGWALARISVLFKSGRNKG